MAEPKKWAPNTYVYSDTPPTEPFSDDGRATTTTNGGAGYGAGGYGANASLDHIREYPSGGLKPRADGTYGYPSDMQLEQAANLSALTGKNAQIAKDKYDRAMDMYKESDKSIKAIADSQVNQAKRKAAQNWQAQQQKQLSALNMIANQSGTGQSGSYWNLTAECG